MKGNSEMVEEFSDKLSMALNEFNIKLSVNQLEQFYQYYEMLIEKNRVMNLTTITDLDEVITKHFADSLSLVKIVEDLDEREYHLIDVGTGAGFPGIALKIAFPQLHVTLLDSLNKKVLFLEEVIEQLQLKNIKGVHGRAEDSGHLPEYREKFDLCLSRAVANLSTLSEYCVPFVKIGGSFISYKSGKIEDELNDAKHCVFLVGGKVVEVKTFLLPGTDVDRSLVKISKVAGTNKKYPRKAGLPSKEPLK